MRSALTYALLFLAISSSSGQNQYWAAKYSRFRGGKAPADLEKLTHRFFEQTTLRRVAVDAKTFPEAMEQVRTALREAHAEFGLGYTINSEKTPPYLKRYHLRARQIMLAAVIDRLATQGGLVGDFSAAGALAFYPSEVP